MLFRLKQFVTIVLPGLLIAGAAFVVIPALADALSDLVPPDALAYYQRGQAASQDARYTEAINQYSEAINLDEEYAAAYWGRGVAHAELGNVRAAIDDLATAIHLDYRYVQDHLQEVEQVDTILAAFEQEMRVNPDSPMLHYLRAQIYAADGKFDAALQDYDRAIALNEDYAVAYYGRGRVYETRSKLELALEDYTRALSHDPGMVQVYARRGALYFGLHQYDQARADYDQYKALTGRYQPFMVQHIDQMDSAPPIPTTDNP